MEEYFPQSVRRDVRVDAELWSEFIFIFILYFFLKWAKTIILPSISCVVLISYNCETF